MTKLYNVLKVSEGGIGQQFAVYLAREAGADKVRPSTSPYIGQTAILVTATKRVHNKISKSLYN
jgi:hypothetical protein